MPERLRIFLNGSIDFSIFVIVSGYLRILSIFPVHFQRILFVLVFTYIFSPLMRWPKRIKQNLNFARPDIMAAQRRQIARNTSKNLALTLFEIFRPEFTEKLAMTAELTGPGAEFLNMSISKQYPVILVSGHFGNYDIIRSNLIKRGMRLGALYRPLNNFWLNKTYVEAIKQTGEPLFPRTKLGFKQMLIHIRNGGSLALLIDQHMDDGIRTTFFGKQAFTSDAAAKLALKHNIPMLPIYAIRLSNNKQFMIWADNPITSTNAAEMTQAFNDNLEQVIRNHMEQWSWPHRRWKERRRVFEGQ